MKLNLKAFALSSGILSGVGLFVATWWKILFQGVTNSPTFLGKIFKGYSLSPVGSVVGLIWAFAVGLIGGAIFVWLYNSFAEPGSKKKEKQE